MATVGARQLSTLPRLPANCVLLDLAAAGPAVAAPACEPTASRRRCCPSQPYFFAPHCSEGRRAQGAERALKSSDTRSQRDWVSVTAHDGVPPSRSIATRVLGTSAASLFQPLLRVALAIPAASPQGRNRGSFVARSSIRPCILLPSAKHRCRHRNVIAALAPLHIAVYGLIRSCPLPSAQPQDWRARSGPRGRSWWVASGLRVCCPPCSALFPRQRCTSEPASSCMPSITTLPLLPILRTFGLAHACSLFPAFHICRQSTHSREPWILWASTFGGTTSPACTHLSRAVVVVAFGTSALIRLQLRESGRVATVRPRQPLLSTRDVWSCQSCALVPGLVEDRDRVPPRAPLAPALFDGLLVRHVNRADDLLCQRSRAVAVSEESVRVEGPLSGTLRYFSTNRVLWLSQPVHKPLSLSSRFVASYSLAALALVSPRLSCGWW